MDKNTTAEDAAQRRIEAALYGMTYEQRQGLTAGAARNILTDLWPAVVAAIRDARAEQRNVCALIADEESEAPNGDSADAVARRVRALK